MPDGTDIQIEDWHEFYEYMPPCDTVAAYPISKASLPGSFTPCRGERFRAQFTFPSAEDTMAAYSALKAGTKTLKDYADHLWIKSHADCL